MWWPYLLVGAVCGCVILLCCIVVGADAEKRDREISKMYFFRNDMPYPELKQDTAEYECTWPEDERRHSGLLEDDDP